MADPVMSNLPTYYHDIIDFIEITKAEDIEFTKAEEAIERAFRNQFILTSDEYGVKRHEKILNIVADPTIETLDFRKKRIISRYSTTPPFTIRFLRNRLDYLVGEGRVIANIDWLNLVLTVTANVDNASVFKEIQHTINSIKPANVVYFQKTSLCDGIVFEEGMYKVPLTRMTRLSTQWRLGKTPFMQRGEKEIIHRAPLHRPTRLSTQWRLGKTPFVEQGADA